MLDLEKRNAMIKNRNEKYKQTMLELNDYALVFGKTHFETCFEIEDALESFAEHANNLKWTRYNFADTLQLRTTIDNKLIAEAYAMWSESDCNEVHELEQKRIWTLVHVVDDYRDVLEDIWKHYNYTVCVDEDELNVDGTNDECVWRKSRSINFRDDVLTIVGDSFIQ